MEKIETSYKKINKALMLIVALPLITLIGIAASIALIFSFETRYTYFSLLLFVVPAILFLVNYINALSRNYKSFYLAYKIYLKNDLELKHKYLKNTNWAMVFEQWDSEIKEKRDDKLNWFKEKFSVQIIGDYKNIKNDIKVQNEQKTTKEENENNAKS